MQTDVRLFSRWGICLFLGVALSFGMVAESRAAGRAETLQAIQAVENPHGLSRPGKYGELGPYQFRRGTWRMHTAVPFERAIDRQISEQVAIQHYEWLKRGLVRAGWVPTPYNIALAWNGGLTAALRGRTPAAAHDYADRVNNLAQEFSALRVARTP